MSRSNDTGGDAGRDDDESATEPEWGDRHARVESQASERWVRADPPGDDWQARHGRTKRDD